MRFGRRVVLVAAAASLAAGPALADTIPSLDLRNFRPPTDPEGSLFLEPVATPGPFNWNVGLWSSYAHDLVVLENSAGERVAAVVQNQFSLDYVLGLGLGDRLAVGLALPTVIYQAGDDVSALIGAPDLPVAALGDLTLTAKAAFLPPGELGGFALGAVSRVTFPTGNAASYVSESAATGELRLLSELSFVAVGLRATLGARIRGEEHEYVGADFGHDLPWGAELVVRPQALGLDDKGRWTWALGARGALAVTPSFGSGPESPVAFSAAARYTVGDVSAIVGAELPLNDAVGVPSVRAVLGFGWAPRFYDADGDGIPDDKDECPELAEDKDGFQDADGCPDFDNDEDGVPDDSDRCPSEREDMDGFEDEDGCPDPDNDHDGINDELDACKDEPGPDSADPKLRGCPLRDHDLDGVPDPEDRCPKHAEDKDGFQDEDGCPDPDNDGDRIPDDEDACPLVTGPQRSDPNLNGCPSPDRDGDTFDDADDKCPDEPETFNGIDDEDGCPDGAAKPAAPLAVLEENARGSSVRLRGSVTFEKTRDVLDVSPASLPLLRALAQLLNENPDYVVMVGVRPQSNTPDAEQEALTKSFAIVFALRRFTHRDEAAETIGWAAVQTTPGARAQGVGYLLLGQKPALAPATPSPSLHKPK
jgi:OOP family OmpA-OmpF porin